MENSVNLGNTIALEIFGIDPGISNGAISKYSNNEVFTIPISKIKDFDQLCDFFRKQADICKRPLAVLERITTFSKDLKAVPKNERDQYIGKMRKLDKMKTHYVELRSALRVSKIPFVEVTPTYWQKYINVFIPNEDYPVRKRRYKDIASEYFPQLKVTLTNCDSLLLIICGRKILQYEPLWIIKNIKK